MKYIAKINQGECVGCNRCVPACPVDAIVGSLSLSHAILEAECIGCKLCLPPCPTDCIDIINLSDDISKEERLERANLAKRRHTDKLQRLAKQKTPLLPEFKSDKETKSKSIQDYLKNLKNQNDKD